MKQKPVRWLLKNSKPERFKMLVLIFANAFFSVLSILFAFTIKGVVDGAVSGDSQKLLYNAIAICVIVILQFVFRFFNNALTEHICAKLEMLFKSHIFSKILQKKHDKINAYHSGELMNRLTSDVAVVSDGLTNIVPIVVASVTRLVCAVIALVMLDWVFAIAFTVAGLLVFLTLAIIRGKLKGLYKKTQETDGKVRSFMQECIENLLAVKVFSVNDKIEEQSNSLQQKNFKVKMKRKNYTVLSFASYNFIFSAGYVFALIYGGIILLTNATFYGSLSAILQLVNNVQVPFMALSNIMPKYYAMLASAERLMEIEDVEEEPKGEYVDRDKVYNDLKGICIENLDFTYDRDVVLKDANLYVKKGDFVVVYGASGIGKSTLMKIMLGVYPAGNGKIYLDTETGKLNLDNSTRTLFSYVPQGNMIFSGSLRENVTFINRDASENQILEALRISCADEFINQLPEGLETMVGENGLGLSEGQVQRIAIARAILVGAPIMLLDESTSALDEQTERKVLENISKMKDKTLIIISHKKSAFKICNRKILLKDKKIFEESDING